MSGRDEPSFIEEASFIRAPLNSRVSMSPAVLNTKGKARMESLDRVSVELQEAMILEDLLFALVVCNTSTPSRSSLCAVGTI